MQQGSPQTQPDHAAARKTCQKHYQQQHINIVVSWVGNKRQVNICEWSAPISGLDLSPVFNPAMMCVFICRGTKRSCFPGSNHILRTKSTEQKCQHARTCCEGTKCVFMHMYIHGDESSFSFNCLQLKLTWRLNYKWVPVNPSMDNPNSWINLNLFKITFQSLMS